MEERTRMMDDSELAISLLDFQLGSCCRDPKGIVIGGVENHDD